MTHTHPLLSCVVLSTGWLAVGLCVIFMAGACIVLLVFRFDIGPLFVHDPRVTREVATVTPICAGYQMPDGLYGVASGVLRYGLSAKP